MESGLQRGKEINLVVYQPFFKEETLVTFRLIFVHITFSKKASTVKQKKMEGSFGFQFIVKRHEG